MEFVNIKNFCRPLTKEEKKQIKEYGEIETIDCTAPLFGWIQTSKHSINNEIRFFEIYENCLIQAPATNYVATKTGIIITIMTGVGYERMYFFEITEYTAALDFYNKMLEALKNNNNF